MERAAKGDMSDDDFAPGPRGLSEIQLIRDALRSHLTRLSEIEREERDRQGYARQPESAQDVAVWEKVAKWPED